MQTLITSIVTSYPFLNRRIVETMSATPTAAPAAKPKPAPAAAKPTPPPAAPSKK